VVSGLITSEVEEIKLQTDERTEDFENEIAYN